jgi:histone H3/H4
MTDLPIAPVDRIMRKAGAARVSEEAARAMAEVLSEYSLEITAVAVKLASHAGRKTIVEDDIKLALTAM